MISFPLLYDLASFSLHLPTKKNKEKIKRWKLWLFLLLFMNLGYYGQHKVVCGCTKQQLDIQMAYHKLQSNNQISSSWWGFVFFFAHVQKKITEPTGQTFKNGPEMMLSTFQVVIGHYGGCRSHGNCGRSRRGGRFGPNILIYK